MAYAAIKADAVASLNDLDAAVIANWSSPDVTTTGLAVELLSARHGGAVLLQQHRHFCDGRTRLGRDAEPGGQGDQGRDRVQLQVSRGLLHARRSEAEDNAQTALADSLASNVVAANLLAGSALTGNASGQSDDEARVRVATAFWFGAAAKASLLERRYGPSRQSAGGGRMEAFLLRGGLGARRFPGLAKP